MKPKSTIKNLPVYQPGKPIEEVKREFGLQEVIKLASNENPFGCSPSVKEAISAELNRTSLYPDGASMNLVDIVSARLGVEKNQLIFGAGSDEIIMMIARAFLEPGDENIMATHTFPQYKHNAEVEGAICIEVPLKEGTHDLEEMLSKATAKTKIVWICNPNNPTGTIVTHQQLKQFMEQISPRVLVVLDEAYAEYTCSKRYPDGFKLLREHKNMIMLRTFSKIYGLASLRIGYGIGDADVIRSINQVREPFNTSRFAQTAAIAAIQDQSFIEMCKEANINGLKYLSAQFDRMGFSYYQAHGNFIMVDVQQPAALVFDALLRKGIIVRGGHQLGFPTSLRVTIGSQQQNEIFINALEQVTANLN